MCNFSWVCWKCLLRIKTSCINSEEDERVHQWHRLQLQYLLDQGLDCQALAVPRACPKPQSWQRHFQTSSELYRGNKGKHKREVSLCRSTSWVNVESFASSSLFKQKSNKRAFARSARSSIITASCSCITDERGPMSSIRLVLGIWITCKIDRQCRIMIQTTSKAT